MYLKIKTDTHKPTFKEIKIIKMFTFKSYIIKNYLLTKNYKFAVIFKKILSFQKRK